MQRLTELFGWDDFPRPLFYGCPFALRFELGGDLKAGPSRFLQATDRVRSIASLVFGETGDLTVAVPFVSRRPGSSAPAKLRQTLKAAGVSATIDLTKLMKPQESEETDDLAAGSRCFLLFDMPNRPDQISALVWAAVATDMDIRPQFPCIAKSYILDLERGIVLHVYDDRGMDLAATKTSLLRPCYERFNDWLLDYNRERMADIFAANAE